MIKKVFILIYLASTLSQKSNAMERSGFESNLAIRMFSPQAGPDITCFIPSTEPLIYIPTKEEHQKEKQKKHELLLQIAQDAVKTKKNIDAILDPKYEFYGYTILTAAARKNCNADILQFALNNGAKINAPDHSGDTALANAVSTAAVKNVRILLGRDASFDDQKLLHSLCSPGNDFFNTKFIKRQMETLHILLEAGVNPNEQNENGETALFKLLFKYMGGGVKISIDAHRTLFYETRKQLILTLLHSNIDHTLKDSRGRTALEFAQGLHRRGDEVLVQFLKDEVEKKDLFKLTSVS